jgi:1-deoxy-D-xylulose-5-phosphate synthase
METSGRYRRVGNRARLLAAQIENGIKGTVLEQSNLFEALKFRYFGPLTDMTYSILPAF